MKAYFIIPIVFSLLVCTYHSSAFSDRNYKLGNDASRNNYLLSSSNIDSDRSDREKEENKEKPLYILASNDRPDEPPKVKNEPPNINNNKAPVENNSLTTQFENFKGFMPWPVNDGYIVTPYGKYNHPYEAKVTLQNYGIDISAKAGSSIQNIFQGTVCRIENIGGTYTVIVNHGQYYSVYSYLSTVSVKLGDKVKPNHMLGVIGTNDEGKPTLHFEICKANGGDIINENPSYWISRK